MRRRPPVAARPTGSQYVLRRGPQRAVITEVGAGLRSWAVHGEELLDTFAADAPADSYRGKVLAPWPNRIRDGRYSFAGAEHQVPLNEPERGCALHGLVLWAGWRPVRRAIDGLTLGHLVHPRPGYPFTLRLEVRYELAAQGLDITLRATNLGAGPAPVGLGMHPYVRAAAGRADEALLEVPAATRVPVDERMLPTGTPIPVGDDDFRRARPIGSRVLDTCFTALARDADGLARVRLAGSGGRAVTVWMDEPFGFVQIYTGDTVEDPARRRAGVAIEPMTCAPDAFNSGGGLRVLDPGASFTARCGLATDEVAHRPS